MNTPHTVSSRFVILHHTHADQQAGSVVQPRRAGGSAIQQAGSASGEHWDLMLERDGVLMTWQLLTEPQGAESLPIRARRIGDHRLAYLTYEGPLSGGRGHVRRIDAGTVGFQEVAPDRLTACKQTLSVTLDGSRLAGRFVLRREDNEWILSIEANRDVREELGGNVKTSKR